MSDGRALDRPVSLVSPEHMRDTVMRRCPRASRMLRRRLAGCAAALPLLAACTVSPEQREATERAWAQRDAERAAECAQRGGRYISSSCLQGGAP